MSRKLVDELESSRIDGITFATLKQQGKFNPCPHPGKYHKAKDGLTIVKPHPQADSCFAREQGYVVCRIDAAYKDQVDIILKALNGEAP